MSCLDVRCLPQLSAAMYEILVSLYPWFHHHYYPNTWANASRNSYLLHICSTTINSRETEIKQEMYKSDTNLLLVCELIIEKWVALWMLLSLHDKVWSTHENSTWNIHLQDGRRACWHQPRQASLIRAEEKRLELRCRRL